ncbi:MAG TPA: pitrilysin family protein [Vicinamibacterales bacterium]|nr:pitrilysin family protein [Vicinamibacterales bacterium]
MTRHMLGCLGVAVALAGVITPAREQASQAVVEKGRAPVSSQLLQIKLPRPAESDLSNGLHVMVLEDRRAPQVTMQLIVRGAGGYFDPADHHGLAQFTAANLREGTATKSSAAIAEQLERLAATVAVNTSMSEEDATVSATSLTEHVDQVLDLVAEIVTAPAFPEQELSRYKAQTRAQLMQQRANPGFLARERFSVVVAGSHPDGRIAPSVEALDKTTRESLVAFHKARYVPDHGVIAIAGDISLAEAIKKLESRFAAWKKTGIAAPRVSDPEAIAKPTFSIVARPNSVQTSLIVGTQAVRRTDPDFYAATVMNKVIGGGPTGRLFRHLREEKGYTYGAGSNIEAPRWTGVWVASTSVRNEVTEPALTDLVDEVRQMRDVRVPDKEFSDAKRSLVAAFALTLESPQALLQNAIVRWRHGLPADYWDRYAERIMAVNQDQVQAVSKKYLDPSRLQIVAVGNEEAVARVLRKLGPVDVYDADGKRVRTY